ncbi:M12 family metallo-peptidase [Nocardioides hwasunensis]|uniref:Uncharacterized protein n=1 Tax=Nocardioides hwasunensis TaxID=397258 RepID=A0ABR8MF52_9ACTN|nr:M12 family metallo-peptidase [Nocardioides hwasunensis]MBD3914726.1 hypothetical protein [Nocardioides hwasunensis]
MTTRSSRPALVVRALVASVLGLSAAVAAAAVPAQASAVPLADGLCAVTSLSQPVRLADALTRGLSAVLVRTTNDLSVDQLLHMSGDETSWIDPCGRIFVREEPVPAAQRAAASAVADAQVPGDVFDLSSRPQSNRTIYLDFDGATYSGTRWKNGARIDSPAFSIDADPATFNDQERAQIYLAWRTVAEDYAPFDVNVTTRAPDASALSRTSIADQTYGMPVVITPTNSVGSDCGCGGLAYVGMFGAVNGTAYQPAWVFTQGTGTAGYDIGQAISHEVGHTFGLSHDGTSQSAYYTGAKGWAPIMGASYGRRASQWSKGEYADADNTEDDVAIIARTAPLLTDDHGDQAVGATAIQVGSRTAGTIGSRDDVDAFGFTASGPTTLSVVGPVGVSDADLQLTVRDSVGRVVATANPVADVATDGSLSATWSADLGATPTAYTAFVEGVGYGDPVEAGRYSDYGSLGGYTVILQSGLVATTPDPTTPDPTPTTPPATTTPTTTATAPNGTPPASHTSSTSAPKAGPGLTFLTTRLPRAKVGKKYRAEIRFDGPVTDVYVDRRLPRGLRWRMSAGRILITGKVRARTAGTFSAELTGDDGSVRMQYRLVAR